MHKYCRGSDLGQRCGQRQVGAVLYAVLTLRRRVLLTQVALLGIEFLPCCASNEQASISYFAIQWRLHLGFSVCVKNDRGVQARLPPSQVWCCDKLQQKAALKGVVSEVAHCFAGFALHTANLAGGCLALLSGATDPCLKVSHRAPSASSCHQRQQAGKLAFPQYLQN